MSKLQTALFLATALFVFCEGLCSHSFADEEHPVAIRLWAENGVTIETMWNVHVALRINDTNRKHLRRAADLELHEKEVKQSANEHGTTRQHSWENELERDFILDRKPNEKTLSWSTTVDQKARSSNAVQVSRIPLGAEGSPTLTLISVDGVRILDSGGVGEDKLAGALRSQGKLLESLAKIDVYLCSQTEQTAESLSSIVELLKPRMIVVAEGVKLNVVDVKIRKIPHNTLAVSRSSEPHSSTTWVQMSDKPWQMSEELVDLFEKKEKACEESRKLFASLSVKQMNFKPSNGTHTPRWNSEHMMARELLYFSQFYHGADPSVPVLNINPKQMPKDYEFRHPDWAGEEEALQTGRVQAFTRRFAYLLEGLDLDRRPKGSRHWTPRALLRQMDRHYSEHTDNVRRKMKLSEWPED